MKNTKIVGAAVSVVAALAFTAVPVTSALAAGASTGVQCFGVNGCKGQGACKTSTNACKGQNSCKGKGVVTEPSADDCAKAGGTVPPS